jgi:putative transposase
MPRRRPRQTELPFRAHGGARRGAGRKPKGEKPGVPHAARPALSGREPVLVTLKMRAHVWNLRTRRAIDRLVPALGAARDRFGMRITQCSVQRDHLHMIVEAASKTALSRGVQGLAVRIARAVHRLMQSRGAVFADRYHHRVLATPRQTRHALQYVLLNARRHGHAPPRERGWLDPFSSAPAFDGWTGDGARTRRAAARASPLPTVVPRTWLLTIGWRRAGGLLDPEHRPGPASTS